MRPLRLSLLPPAIKRYPYICHRCLHKQPTKDPTPVPSPTPFVPNHETFLSLIGRDLKKHASKFKSWEHLFTINTAQMQHLGIAKAKERRYLHRWIDKFRRGDYGIGGDLQHVDDGIAELRVVEVPRLRKQGEEEGTDEGKAYASAATTPGMRKLVINLPRGARTYEGPPENLKKPFGFTLQGGREVVGPFIQWVPGTSKTVALFKVTEGMWEHRLGHKVDGGERRKAEVRAKRRLEERRKARG
ncbi:MAG: hypothetical protein Q9160_004686 [Pyrenula sp. 1 TL-2023]